VLCPLRGNRDVLTDSAAGLTASRPVLSGGGVAAVRPAPVATEPGLDVLEEGFVGEGAAGVGAVAKMVGVLFGEVAGGEEFGSGWRASEVVPEGAGERSFLREDAREVLLGAGIGVEFRGRDDAGADGIHLGVAEDQGEAGGATIQEKKRLCQRWPEWPQRVLRYWA